MGLRAEFTPEAWIRHIFSAKAAQEGGVVRRKVRDIERYVGLAAFCAELDRRGFSAVENAGQLVIFCNREPVRLATGPAIRRPISSKKSDQSL